MKAQAVNARTGRPRVPQTERTALMKGRLAQAAFDLIHEQGYVNFRTAAVARRAGVSQGAQLHHYPTKNSLALAAIEHAYDRSTEATAQRIASLPRDIDPLDALLDDAQAFFLSPNFRVALDILMAGGADATLKQELTALTLRQRGRVERLWLERLVDAGWSLSAAEDLLAMTLCLVRGLAVRALVEPIDESRERLFARWRKLVAIQFSGKRQPNDSGTV